MRKKTRNLLYLIVALLVLILVYGVVSAAISRKEKLAEEAGEEQSSEETILIGTFENPVSLQWNNGTEEMAFHKEQGSWQYDMDEHFPVSQSEMEELVDVLASLEADQRLAARDELSAYGFLQPTYSLKMELEDGSRTLLIGNTTSSGGYYAMMQGEEDVYVVSGKIISCLGSRLEDYLQLITMPELTLENVSLIQVDNGSKLQLKKSEAGWSVSEGGQTRNVTNETAVTDVLETIKGFVGGECVDYYCTDEEKAQYGLDVPYFEVTVQYVDDGGVNQKFHLYVGDAVEDSENYYYCNSESGEVAMIASSYVNALAESYELEYVK